MHSTPRLSGAFETLNQALPHEEVLMLVGRNKARALEQARANAEKTKEPWIAWQWNELWYVDRDSAFFDKRPYPHYFIAPEQPDVSVSHEAK